jgi:thiosulfate/3-mercaptopyruvate sulfurtransferase
MEIDLAIGFCTLFPLHVLAYLFTLNLVCLTHGRGLTLLKSIILRKLTIKKTVSATPWIIDATEAKDWIKKGATVLDVRPYPLWLLGHAPGAVWVSWKRFTFSERYRRGKLLSDSAQLQSQLRRLGIDQDQPVVVVGHPQRCFYFGEDGRIVWMLRTLGHGATAWVDGGQKALTEVGVSRVLGLVSPQSGDFTVRRTSTWLTEKEELQGKLDTSIQIIDSREAREYQGKTPYGESRGGHLPRAVHFYFKDCLNPQGQLKPQSELLAVLQGLGVDPHCPTVVYCTGGVRSAFLTGVLQQLGFRDVKNYPGSTWEWSATGYPLISGYHC